MVSINVPSNKNKLSISTGTAGKQTSVSIENVQSFAINKAKDWAEKMDGPIGNEGYSAKYHATQAAISAANADNSATETEKTKNTAIEEMANIKQSLLTNSDFVAVRNSLDEITIVSENLGTIETSGNNIEAIKTTSSNINNVNTTANNIGTIQTAVTNLTTMNTVLSNLTPIKNTANNITAINNVNTNIEAVKSNYTNISDIKANATNMTDIKNTAKLVTTLDEKVDIDDMVEVDFVEVPTIVEVSDPSLMPSWYIVYSNGWIEQGGYSNGGGTFEAPLTVNLLKPYTNENYCVTFGSITTSSSSGFAWLKAKEKNLFKAVGSDFASGVIPFNWRACGY